MGMLVYVHPNPLGDCTLNGISSAAKSLCVVNIEGPFKPSDTTPAALLQSHQPGCLRIVPAELVADQWKPVRSWVMMGGNFGATSDSRFGEACERLLGHRFYGAVAIHDRIEPPSNLQD